MLNERRQAILKIIEELFEVRLTELVKLYPNISEMTLRRDLDYLAENGLISRTHGGAQQLQQKSLPMYDYSSRIISNIEAKTRIAGHALKLLEQNCSIFLDAGSTITALASRLPDINLCVTTNAPNTALEIMKRNNIEVILLGGSLNKTAVSTTGPFALHCLDNLNIDIAFLGTGGFSIEKGLTNSYTNECELKRKVINIAKKKIVLMDHTKFNRNLPFTSAHLDEIDVIVTDQKPSVEILDAVAKAKVRIIY